MGARVNSISRAIGPLGQDRGSRRIKLTAFSPLYLPLKIFISPLRVVLPTAAMNLTPA